MVQDEIIAELRYQFGIRLKGLRKQRGLTQEQLSRVSGVDRSRISHLESGDSTTTVDTVMLISCGLGIPLSELFAGVDVPLALPAELPVVLSFPDGESVYYRHARL